MVQVKQPSEEKEDLELEGLQTMSDSDVTKALTPDKPAKIAQHNTHLSDKQPGKKQEAQLPDVAPSLMETVKEKDDLQREYQREVEK